MTVIRVGAERWDVPIGFGAAYARCVFDPCRPSVLRDILGLVGFDASEEVIEGWTLRQRVEAEVYAAREHASASDNPVQRHPRPAWLPEPWRGPDGELTPVGIARAAHSTPIASFVRSVLHAVSARMPILVCVGCVAPTDEVLEVPCGDYAICDRCQASITSTMGVCVRGRIA